MTEYFVEHRDYIVPVPDELEHVGVLVEPLTVVLIVIGSVVIAVGASVVPAIRAASLHPVKALRF